MFYTKEINTTKQGNKIKMIVRENKNGIERRASKLFNLKDQDQIDRYVEANDPFDMSMLQDEPESVGNEAYENYVDKMCDDMNALLVSFNPETCGGTSVYNKIYNLYDKIGNALKEFEDVEDCSGLINVKELHNK